MSRGMRQLPTRQADVILKDDGEDTVLVAPSGSTFVLNPTARAIWELCDGATTIEELAEAIAQVFDIDAATASEDVSVTIERLKAAELVTAGDR